MFFFSRMTQLLKNENYSSQMSKPENKAMGLSIFTDLAPCMYIYFVCWCNLFWGLSFAFRSHDQFKASHWLTPPRPHPKDFFRIELVDCPRVEPQKQGVVPNWTHGSVTRGAIKTRRCSGLDSWIVSGWSLRNKELFQIGLVDRSQGEP